MGEFAGGSNQTQNSLYLGDKNYELTNHLGNVLSTVTDRKIPINNGGQIDGYLADISSATQYYPFGYPIAQYPANNSYRFGFNGQEKDDEITGVPGSIYTAEFWMYDSRIGRRWNVDPVFKEWESSYLCFSGNPILMIDPNGDNADEYDLDLSNGDFKKVSDKGGKETQHINVVGNGGEKIDQVAIPGNTFNISHSNVEGYIKLDIYGGNENNNQVYGEDFVQGLNGQSGFTRMPRTIDGLKIPRLNGYKSPAGGALSVGGVFCLGMGVAMDVGFAIDGKGKSAPFLNLAFATGVEAGVGLSYTPIPAGTGLKDFAAPGGSGSVSGSLFFAGGSYTSSKTFGGGFSFGMEAGVSFRANKTILGSWSEMGDYYSKVGHLTR